MPYYMALVPILFLVGVVGVVVSLARRRWLSALAFGMLGVGSIVYGIARYSGTY